MTRKRKAPERKPSAAARASGVASLAAAALGRAMARHPVLLGGSVCFAIVFGFVSANALWYQPGRHPSPLLRTRDARDVFALTGINRNPMLERDPAEVVTYRIEREPAAPEASEGGLTVDDIVAAGSDASTLTLAVQRELKHRGFYSGAEDGLPGPMTRAAIAAFQKTIGMAEDGEASAELLAALQVDAGATAAVPLARPSGDLTSADAAADPVAAAIRSAERAVVTAPAASPTAPVAAPLATPVAVEAGLVLQIQRGLSNIAYADVSIDGVAGAQTRAAIRHFERHYRLPETGEPNEAVLKKLKSIGAL